MSSLQIENKDEGIIFAVKVVPGSSKTSIAGILDGMLKVKVAAVAEKGKANSALIDLLSKKLNIKKKAISIKSGQTNPAKTIRINGITEDQILERLSLLQ